MSDTAASASRTSGAFAARDYLLYALVVFAWSTSWIALKMQLGVVAPEVSLVWRFALAAALMFAWALASGQSLRFGPADHLRFAGLGLTIFSLNFALFYYGGQAVASGLLAVVFSLASVFNILLGAALLGQPIRPRVAAGAALGAGGVALLFWPEMSGTSLDGGAAWGLALCVLGTLSFCLGNMLSAANQQRGLAVIPASAWGMSYGVLFLTLFALAMGDSFTMEPTVRYLGALLWLAVMASVIAFAAYLTLLGRIGADRAGYSTVMFPVIALLISTLVEGYVWTASAFAGVVLVMAGNILVLGGRR